MGIFTQGSRRDRTKNRDFEREKEPRRGWKSTWCDVGRYTAHAIREAIFDKRGNEAASRRRSRSIGRWNNSDEITTPCENAFNAGLAETRASFALGRTDTRRFHVVDQSVQVHSAWCTITYTPGLTLVGGRARASLPLNEKCICPKKETPFSVARPLYKVLLVLCCRFYSQSRPEHRK